MKNILFIGLGAMGLPMAKNLVSAGYHVWGLDIREDKLQALIDYGGKGNYFDNKVLPDVDVVILMVVNGEQCFSVLQETSLLDRLPNKSKICVMSTCAVAEIQALSQYVHAKGHLFVDAPVSGGTVGATKASLTIMCSGYGEIFENLKPIFNVLGNRVFKVGDSIGQGTMLKIINQLLCGVHIAATAEAFALAEKVGIDLSLVQDVLGQSSAASWMLNDRGPRMQESNPVVSSAVDIFVKDLGLVLGVGSVFKATLPMTTVAYQMFFAASARGEGNLDDSQVIRSYRAVTSSPA